MTVKTRLITIFGGTGNQGGSVVRSILKHQGHAFRVRVITRDIRSSKAQAISELGAELFEAHGLDMDQMIDAFTGSWGAFINSNSDDHSQDDNLDAPNFYDLDVTIMDAAEAAGVKHVVYSSGGNTHRATRGRVHIPGFECKFYAEEHARSHKHFATFTAVLPASFMECWLDETFCRTFNGFPWFPEKPDRSIILKTPPYGGDGKMPWVSLEHDFGDIVHGIFLDPQQYDGQHVQAISEAITFQDMARAFTAGVKSCYEPLSSWTDIPRDGTICRDETRRIFFMMKFCGGKWYAEHTTDLTNAIACKRAARVAQGASDGDLTGFEKFFRLAQKIMTRPAIV